LRVSLGLGVWGTYQATVISMCEGCYQKYTTFHDDLTGETYALGPHVTRSGQCAGCGRAVHQTERRYDYLHFYCSDRCRQKHQPGYQAALARTQRCRETWGIAPLRRVWGAFRAVA
jgi:hypothetical protein